MYDCGSLRGRGDLILAQLDLEELNGTPVFSISSVEGSYGRVHGATFDKARKRWLFPAYPPFGQLVVKDLRRVAPSLPLSAAAQDRLKYLESIDSIVENRTLPEGFGFVTKPFDHQVEALTYLFHHPRFALFFDAGTGKSKVAVDLFRLLKKQGKFRALVLGPKVTVRNWVREIEIHGGGEVTAQPVVGTADQKRKRLQGYKEYDVTVCSFGTARNMGLPRLHKATLGHIKDAISAGKKISDSGVKDLVRAVRQVSDPDRQAAYVLAWAWGAPVAQVHRTAEEEAKLIPQWLEDIDYDVIVVDESHCIKDSSSDQTKTVLALSRKAARRYIFSGTPALGDPRHLYPQMRFLSPVIIPEDPFKFSDMFLVRSPWNKRIVTGFKNMNVLNGRVQRVSIRKRKDECLDLPDRHIIDVPVEMGAEQRRLYNTLVSAMSADLNAFFQDPTGSLMEVQNAATLLNKLGQVVSGFVIDNQRDSEICNGCPHLARCVEENIRPYTPRCTVVQTAPPRKVNYLKDNPKMEALSELLDASMENPENKMIVWGVYRAELEMISEALDKKGLMHVLVDGSTGGNVQKRIDRFNNDPECRVYVGQIATGVGITLNAANYMTYYNMDWSLATYLQSIDRNYRAGQTRKTTVYRLVAEGTVDTYKAKALDEKKDISAVLTNKLACTACPQRFECLKNGVELFDPGCIYKRTVKRTVAKAKVIE